MTQLRSPVVWAASSRVRLANAAQEGPWSVPSLLTLPQISASTWAGVLVFASLR